MTDEEIHELELRQRAAEAEEAARARVAAQKSEPIMSTPPPREADVSVAPPVTDPGMPGAFGLDLSPRGLAPKKQPTMPSDAGGFPSLITTKNPAVPLDITRAPTKGGMDVAPPRTVVSAGAPTPEEIADKKAESTHDAPLDLSGGASGASGASGHSVVQPAGMYPEKLETSVKQGKPVAEDVRAMHGAAAGLQLEGAGIERSSEKQYYTQQRDLALAQAQAASDALAQHQKVQVQREADVKNRVAEIEALNARAVPHPEDAWSDRRALAGVFGAIMAGIGAIGAGTGKLGMALAGSMAASEINTFVNQDIQSKLAMREGARQMAGQKMNLLNLHLEQLKDKDKAIDATKLALYDSALKQAEALKAEHAGRVSDAAYDAFVAGVLDSKAEVKRSLDAQETADVSQSFEQKWHAAKILGGGAPKSPGIREGERVITIPASDKTGEHDTHVAVPHEAYKDLADMAGATNALVLLDREALKKRAVLRQAIADSDKGIPDAIVKVATLKKELSELQRKRIQTEQKADKEGVTRDTDFKHAMEMGVDYTGGIGGGTIQIANHDRTIQHSMNTLTGMVDARVRGATGWVVKPAVVTDKTGNKLPGFNYTGELYTGRAVPPEGDDVK